MPFLKALLHPLQSRKVRTGVATVIAAYLAQYVPGLAGDKLELIVFAILGVGVSVVLGIAYEDGAKLEAGVHPANLKADQTAAQGEWERTKGKG